MDTQEFPLSLKTRNLVRFCRHPEYDALHECFISNFAFRDNKSRFSILKNIKTAPGPDECFSLKFSNAYALFNKLLGMEIEYPGQAQDQIKEETYYNSMNYYRSHIEEIFYQNSTRPLPPIEGKCTMFFPETDVLLISYELRNMSTTDVPVRLRWFSRPNKGLRHTLDLSDNQFTFSNVQKERIEYESFAVVTAEKESVCFQWNKEIFQTNWLTENIPAKDTIQIIFHVDFSLDRIPRKDRKKPTSYRRTLHKAILRTENVYGKLKPLPEDFACFENLVLKAAGTLQSLRSWDYDRNRKKVTTIHPGKGALAQTYFWDGAFTLLGLDLLDDYEAITGMVNILVDGIKEDGTPPSHYYGGRYFYSYQQPILAWGINHLDPESVGVTLLKKWYKKLARYVHHWINDCDANQNGLVEYPNKGTCWDDSLRWQTRFPITFKKGEKWSEKDWGDMKLDLFESVDTNTHLYLECLSLSQIARALGKTEDIGMWQKHAATLKKQINDNLFNPKAGIYQDRSIEDGRFTEMNTAGSFLPLYAGITPKSRAGKICRDYLLNPDRFYTPFPFPTLERNHSAFRSGGFLKENSSHPGWFIQTSYWLGRSWPHVSYWLVGALYNSGLKKEADETAYKILDMMNRSEAIYECYDSLTGYGNGHPEFMWSSAAVLALTYQLYKRD